MMAAPARSTMGIRASARAGRSRIGWYHTQMHTAAAVDWSAIDTVLLDMDGTLLDLRFDNWFWLELIPGRYAAAHGLELRRRRRQLLAPKFVEVAGDSAVVLHRVLDPGAQAGHRAASSARRWRRSDFCREPRVSAEAQGRAASGVVLVTNAHPDDTGHQE